MLEEENLDKVTWLKGNDIPADKWSFLNCVIIYINSPMMPGAFPAGSRGEQVHYFLDTPMGEESKNSINNIFIFV